MSPTYCHCSVGFVREYLEDVLQRPVKVKFLHSAISGGQECKSEVRLQDS